MNRLLPIVFAGFLAAPAFAAPTLDAAKLKLASANVVVLDADQGKAIYAKAADEVTPIASLTKLMTGYLVFDALRAKKVTLDQKLPVSVRAWKMPGSRMFIDPKMQVSVDDLLSGMIIQSGNDATMALAEGVGGTAEQFVKMMNDQAAAMGLKGSAYKNPEGLTEPGHTTTARDLAVITAHLQHDFPQYMHYYSTKQYRYPGTPASNSNNRNLLLYRDPSVDGLKTGYTEAAGYCMIVTAKRDFPNLVQAGAPAGSAAAAGSRRLLSIVLGSTSENARANESQKLLNWGYTAYEAIKLFDANQAVVTPAVWKGKAPTVKLGQVHSLIVAVPAGSATKIKTQVSRTDPLVAPFNKGQQLGVLKVTLDDQPLVDVPLLALEAVEQAGVFGRAWDAMRLWIK